ncbi:hypothetical protein AYI70_g12102 [Smittium culicis]|uniref:Phosphatidate phosphatase APP1 catalytic domain-containing protein n=1 Tax=Smittium culicis TaxID=133412 RepID=A0A1R1WYV4_9FUNG|nr:hypothetical protein AYI70_g12102 [Smittium culicis]
MNSEDVEDLWLFPSYAFRDESIKGWRVQLNGFCSINSSHNKRERLLKATLRTLINVKKDTSHEENFKKRTDYLLCKPVEKSKIKIHFEKYNELANVLTNISISSSDKQSKKSSPPPIPKKPTHLRGDMLPPPLPPRNSPNEQSSNLSKNDLFDLFDSAYTFEVENGNLHGEILLLDELLNTSPLKRVMDLSKLEFLLCGQPMNFFSSFTLPNSPNSRSLSSQNSPLPPTKDRILGEEYNKALLKLIDPVGVSVISDIDDTIKELNFDHGKKKMMITTFASEPKMVKGMQPAYIDWKNKFNSEFHYVSNSPKQLYPIISDFLYTFSFPISSLHLREFNKTKIFNKANLVGNMENKHFFITEILRKFPNRKFIFVGDSGEKDLEMYTSIASNSEFKHQIINIFIRDIFSSEISENSNSDESASINDSISLGSVDKDEYSIINELLNENMDDDFIYENDSNLLSSSGSGTLNNSGNSFKNSSTGNYAYNSTNAISSQTLPLKQSSAINNSNFSTLQISDNNMHRANTYSGAQNSAINSDNFSNISGNKHNSYIEPGQIIKKHSFYYHFTSSNNPEPTTVKDVLESIKEFYIDTSSVDLFYQSNNQNSESFSISTSFESSSTNFNPVTTSEVNNELAIKQSISTKIISRISTSSSYRSLLGLESNNLNSSDPIQQHRSSTYSNFNGTNSNIAGIPNIAVEPVRLDFFARVLENSKLLPNGMLKLFINGNDLKTYDLESRIN